MHSYDITVKVAESRREQLFAQADAERLARASRSSGTARKPSSVPRRRRGFVAWWRAGALAPQV